MELFRSRFGAGFKLAIDAHTRYNLDAAIYVAKALEAFNLVFFEEPVPPDQLEAYKKVAAATTVPIATGERLANKRESKEIMATGAMKYLQPDTGNDLGILETFQMAAMAQTYGIDMAPHCWCGSGTRT